MAQEIPGAHLVGELAQKALIMEDGRVLMVRGIGGDDWDFPGGRLHINESLKEGLMRELREELAADVEVGEPFMTDVWYGSPTGVPRILVLYLCRLVSGGEFTIAADELEEVKWISKEDAKTLPVDEIWRRALDKFFSK